MTTVARTRTPSPRHHPQVATVSTLIASGTTRSTTRSRLAAGKWQRFGRAVVLHNGPLTRPQARAVVLTNAGPRALTTSFTALEVVGLTGWHRDAHHVLVPSGARVTRPRGFEIVVHELVDWPPRAAPDRPHVHHPAAAAVVAAASCTRPHVACALLAATVQQRLVTAADLDDIVRSRTNLRHRAVLLAALADIAMGAQALSEIDFALLCRTAGLVEPLRQAVRVEPTGRRRYLDAEWIRPDRRRVVVEVDGALHLHVSRWWDDQLRQNEVAIQDSVVLRFPSVVVRERDPIVVDQLRRAGIPTAPRRTVA